jgi:hypothetical protein
MFLFVHPRGLISSKGKRDRHQCLFPHAEAVSIQGAFV